MGVQYWIGSRNLDMMHYVVQYTPKKQQLVRAAARLLVLIQQTVPQKGFITIFEMKYCQYLYSISFEVAPLIPLIKKFILSAREILMKCCHHIEETRIYTYATR